MADSVPEWLSPVLCLNWVSGIFGGSKVQVKAVHLVARQEIEDMLDEF